ncbi:monocarboxylate transporter 14-like [Uloborus diversus]|uniref:monocarboxylate transporter 14-like n=1 Tax=Uloborus diversus TaxID=327109 RepID=UPI00240A5D6C|nr:monocarboxylate transporter 14-like [Uloborus diversus]
MDSTTIESGKDVDSNDSNINGTLYKTDNINSAKCVKGERHSNHGSTTSVSSSSSNSTTEAAKSSLPVPPDGGWGWVVVFASFMINLIADGVSFSFGILYVDFVKYFGESKAKTSWVGSIILSMPLLAGPVASYLIDRYGCQKMCILGSLLSAVAFILSIYANSLEVLCLTFTIAGLGLALCYVTSIVIVAYYFEKRRSLATGLAACGTGIGTLLFPLFTGHLLTIYDWQGTLLILAGFFLNMMVFGALMRDLEPPSKSASEKQDNSESCTLEDSERLCSSLVQLPTYLRDNLPVEVISELSSKEGGYLNSLLEQHPHLFGAIMTKSTAGSENSSSIIPQNHETRKEKKRGKSKSVSTERSASQNHSAIPRESSFTSKLDAKYLRNMKIQRGSITYRGAMLNIHRYRLRASSCPDIYRNSMVTIAEEKSCLFLSDLKDLMLAMFDFSNFKNVAYTVFCISNFLLYACVDVPYVYIPDQSITRGTDMNSASLLISILGVLNCLGVVIVGYIGDKPWIDSSLLYSGFIVLSGFSLILLPVIAEYYVTATLVGIYGFTISANYTLVPVIIVNLISLDNFTGAYGLLLLVQGIANLIGPPIAGALFDMTGNYDITFYCTGFCVIFSGAMVIPIAKSVMCRKTLSEDDKDLAPLNSKSSKVRFEEHSPKNNAIAFVSTPEEPKVLKDKPAYDPNENPENSVPLLSEVNVTFGDIPNDDKIGSMYENPLNFV